MLDETRQAVGPGGQAWKREIGVALAGPAVNLLLAVMAAAFLAAAAPDSQLWAKPYIHSSHLSRSLVWINLGLALFNLLPAYPLDGGRTLDAILGAILGPVWSVRIVATLGLVVAAGVAFYALPTGFFMLLIAFFLAQANWEALQSIGGWRR